MWDEGREVEPRKGLDVSEGLRGWRWFSEWEAGREPTRLPRAGHRLKQRTGANGQDREA